MHEPNVDCEASSHEDINYPERLEEKVSERNDQVANGYSLQYSHDAPAYKRLDCEDPRNPPLEIEESSYQE